MPKVKKKKKLRVNDTYLDSVKEIFSADDYYLGEIYFAPSTVSAAVFCEETGETVLVDDIRWCVNTDSAEDVLEIWKQGTKKEEE